MIDSNASQFARLGNPWVSERDRKEWPEPNRRERRENLRGAKPKLGPVPKTTPGPGRAESARMQKILRSREARRRMALGRGEISRTCADLPRPEHRKHAPVSQHRHPAQRELDPWSDEAIAAKRRNLAAAAARELAESAQRKADREIAMFADLYAAMNQ